MVLLVDEGEAPPAYVARTMGATLTQGLAALCREKPSDPVTWLAEWLIANKPPPEVKKAPGNYPRANTLLSSPSNAKYMLCVVQFKVAGAKNGGSDKGPDGNRIDSIPIANGVIHAGSACDLILYDANNHEQFVTETAKYDALIVRINPGQLSQGTPE